MEKKKIMSCFLVLAIIFMALAMSGCTDTEDEETIEPNAEMSVLDAELRATDSYDLTPDSGNVYLYLQVEIESLNEEEDLSLNPFNFELETDAGSMYSYNDQIDAPDNLSPGSTSQFWISFEIPEDETGGTLYYEPSWLQDEPYTDSVPSYSTEPPKLASLSVLDAEIRDTDTYGLTPSSGNVYLYLKAKVTNKKDDGDISLNAFNFELETNTGGKYSYNDHENKPDSITAGNSATFWISFEIPQSETGDILHYEPSWGDTIQANVPSY